MKKSYSYNYTKVASEAKRANTRLRAIEKANLTKTSAYENVRRMGFDDSKYIAYTKKGEIKFRTDVSKMSESELKEHQRVIEDFLQSKSSKVGEIKKRRQQAYDKWKKELMLSVLYTCKDSHEHRYSGSSPYYSSMKQTPREQEQYPFSVLQ